ncbi:hypothetical protein [Serinibacter arcticus]|uniref:hypothetical protein n=1 Tax=Serinibacter arcticus TaxID=1655435 RepID=UPI001F2B54AB|nr:hypothetical protein [Serinibacter arcticus]
MTSPLTQFRPERVPATALRELAAAFHLTPDATSSAGSADPAVTGVSVASDAIVPGDLFVGSPASPRTAHGSPRLPSRRAPWPW